LINILIECKLKGSTTESGYIIGDTPAVCFQDSTPYGLAQNLLHEQQYREELGGKNRYQPFGISFSKFYLYNKGARPVIYEKKDMAKSFLKQSEWWRIVNFDLFDINNIIDWSHEREWRLPHELDFEIENAYVFLPNSTYYTAFIEDCPLDILKKIKGINVLSVILK